AARSLPRWSGHGAWRRARRPPSVLHHVRLEDPAIRSPARAVEAAGGLDAVRGAVRHEEGVVGIVVSEESLAPEAEQAVARLKPLVERGEAGFVTASIDRIGLAQAPRHHP